jgi:hypothetical protein
MQAVPRQDSTMTTIRFTARGIRHYTVNFNYDPNVVAIVKSVPGFARTYESATKMWMVNADFADQLAGDLRDAGFTVIGMVTTNEWAKILLRSVGPDRHDQVVRALTKVLHPDNPDTGDAELQRQLNTARDDLADRNRR